MKSLGIRLRPGKNGGYAWCEAGPGSSGSSVDMESSQNGHTAPELPRVCQLLPGIHKRICGQGVSDAEADAQQGKKKFEWNDEAQVAFENIKRELCEAPVLGMPTEKGMYVLDTDASVVAISGILHQEQEWNGRTVLRPIAYGSKVLSDTEMKYGAPKAEMFAVVVFVEKYRAYLGSAPFKLRVDNRALSWLKTYSMDQSYIGRWIVRLDGYHMIIEHRMRDKHQNADSLSKKTEFYERLEQKQANQAEIKEGFSFLDKETYEALPLTRWLDKSGHPIPGHPELPVEKAAEIKIPSKEDPVPLDLLLRSNLVQQELSRMNINSLSLLDKTVQVTPQVMRMLGGFLERELTRDDPDWMTHMIRWAIRGSTKYIRGS